MALTKTIDDGMSNFNKGITDVLGGGLLGGGSIAGAGLGAIIGAAISKGIANSTGSSSKNNSGTNSGTGVLDTLKGVNIAEPTQPNLDELKEVGQGIINAAPSVPKTESTAGAIPDIGKVESLPPADRNDTTEQLPLPNLPELDIKDETSTNVEQAIDNSDTLAMLKQLRDEQWAREDAIRAETQQREDTAFSRGIADMRRAGVNVNLVGAQPAESGGGITNATGVDGGIYTAEVNKYVSLLETALNNEFKGNENTKDRITETIGKLVQAIVVGLMK